jgi:hypothetical protein
MVSSINSTLNTHYFIKKKPPKLMVSIFTTPYKISYDMNFSLQKEA